MNTESTNKNSTTINYYYVLWPATNLACLQKSMFEIRKWMPAFQNELPFCSRCSDNPGNPGYQWA